MTRGGWIETLSDSRARRACGGGAAVARTRGARCACAERSSSRGFSTADVGAAHRALHRRVAARTRLRAAARAPGRTMGKPPLRRCVLRPGRAHRQAADAECAGTPARSRARPRIALGRSQRAHLPDARAPDVPHRLGGRRRLAVLADGEVGRPVRARVVRHALQRAASAPARSRASIVRAVRDRSPRRSAARREAVLHHPDLQLARRCALGNLPAPVHRFGAAFRRTRRVSRRPMSRRSICSTR